MLHVWPSEVRQDRVTLWCEWRWVLWCSTCTGSEEQNGIYITCLWSTNSQSVNHPTKLAWFTNKITNPQRACFFSGYEIWYCPVNSDSWYFRWPASVGSSGALCCMRMLSAATLWHRLVQLSASADLCFAVFWKGSKQRSPITGSFVQSTKASRDWKDRKSESTREKGLWFGDRWGVFIWLQRLHEAFSQSFGSLVALSVVEAKHVMCLGSYLNPSPAVSNKRSKQLYFLQVWPNMSMAIFFPPFFAFYPLFPVLCSIHFY